MTKIFDKISNSTPSIAEFFLSFVWFLPFLVINCPLLYDNPTNDRVMIWLSFLFASILGSIVCNQSQWHKQNEEKLAERCDKLLDEIYKLNSDKFDMQNQIEDLKTDIWKLAGRIDKLEQNNKNK